MTNSFPQILKQCFNGSILCQHLSADHQIFNLLKKSYCSLIYDKIKLNHHSESASSSYRSNISSQLTFQSMMNLIYFKVFHFKIKSYKSITSSLSSSYHNFPEKRFCGLITTKNCFSTNHDFKSDAVGAKSTSASSKDNIFTEIRMKYNNSHDNNINSLISRLYRNMLSANWNDYFLLVQNQPFWDNEFIYICDQFINDNRYRGIKELLLKKKKCNYTDIMNKNLSSDVRGHFSETDKDYEAIEKLISTDFMDLCKLMDLYYIVEDIRDHINEILEAISRSYGIANLGYFKSEKIDNVYDHAQTISDVHTVLLEKFPERFHGKIDETVGQGLVLLRQNKKFYSSKLHKYYF